MNSSKSRRRCRCHSDLIYASLVECPACGHWSFEDLGNWGGCERKACGFEHVGPVESDAHEIGPAQLELPGPRPSEVTR